MMGMLRKFLDFPNPEPLVRGTDPDPGGTKTLITDHPHF